MGPQIWRMTAELSSAQSHNGLRALLTPVHPRLIQPLSNDVFAGGLHHTAADVVTLLQEALVAHPSSIVGEVGKADEA